MKIKKVQILLLTLLLCLSGKYAYSQIYDTAKYQTKEIKVLSNKISTDIFDSPVKIQVIDKSMIENKNGENLSDVLQLAGGILIKSYGGNSSLSTISLNGLGAEHTLILLNGFKINSLQNNQIDLTTISKDNIERIEILNNGSSSLYGSEAIGGVINIVTKRDFTKNFEVKITGQVGSYNQKRIEADIEKTFNNINIGLEYSKESSINAYEYFFNNGTQRVLKERANSNYNNSNYTLNAGYSNNKHKIDAFVNFCSLFRNIPGVETGSAPSKSSQQDKNWNNNLSYQYIFSGKLSLKTQIDFQNNITGYNDGSLINSYYKNIFLSGSTQLSYIKNRFELTSGYEIIYATLKSNEVESNIRRVQSGIFAASKIGLTENVKIFPSVRYDYISDLKKHVISGKFGINIKPFRKYNLNLKASSGNNFASPTFNELYWKDLGNKNLLPERSVSIDGGAIFNFNSFTDNTLEITYSYVSAKDKIVWSPNSNGLWTPKNIGQSISNDILFEANIQKNFGTKAGIKINVSYCYTQSTRTSSDYPGDPAYKKQIFYIPYDLAKGSLQMKFRDTGLNLFYTFTGRRFTNFENTNYLQAIDLLEGNIFQNIRINKFNAQLKLEVNNLLNSNYQLISGYPMPLRNFKLGLSLEY